MQNQWSEMRVLVTGGCGFVGSHLCDALVKRGADVTVYDNLSTAVRLPDGCSIVQGDCRDAMLLSNVVEHSDFVFHLAAHADVRRNMEHPKEVWENNVDATMNLLECMRREKITKLAFASSAIVYGPGRPLTKHEWCPLSTNSIYGASKIAGEHLIQAYELETGMQAWRFRFAGMLGPRYTHGHVSDFVRSLQRDPTKLTVLGDGYQSKAYIDVRDCVSAMLEIVDTDSPGAYNVASTETLVIRDSVKQICDVLGVSPQVTYGDTAGGWPTDPPNITVSTRHPISARPLHQALRDTVLDLLGRT